MGTYSQTMSTLRKTKASSGKICIETSRAKSINSARNANASGAEKKKEKYSESTFQRNCKELPHRAICLRSCCGGQLCTFLLFVNTRILLPTVNVIHNLVYYLSLDYGARVPLFFFSDCFYLFFE